MTNNLTRKKAPPIIYPLYLKLIAFGNAGFGEWFLSWRNNYFFFSCRAYKLGDDEYSASVFGIEYCIQILYLAFSKNFHLLFLQKGWGVRCERDHCPVLTLFVITWFTADLWDPDKWIPPASPCFRHLFNFCKDRDETSFNE